MTWLKLDDSFDEHPKVCVLSDAAFRAHVSGMCYCARHLTDGFLPTKKAKEIAGESLPELTRKTRYGQPLWGLTDGEYEIHGYLDYNPSREKVIEERSATRERVGRWRNGSGNAVSNGVGNGVSTEDVRPPRTRTRPSTQALTPNPSKDKPLSFIGIPESVLGYWIAKNEGKEPTPDDVRSLRVLCKKYPHTIVGMAIGQAVMQGERVDNFALITTICKAESS